MGLGSIKDVSLAEARELAHAYRRQVRDGVDPIAQRGERRLETASAVTFQQCAVAYIGAHRAGWSNAEHARQWDSTLRMFVYPAIGASPVSAIDTPLVLKVLEPIWRKNTVTATRLRGRIESVLDWARVRGYLHRRKPGAMARSLDLTAAEAKQGAEGQAPSRPALSRNARAHARASRPQIHRRACSRGAGADSGAQRRTAWRTVARVRSAYRDLDDPASTDEGSARASRPAV